MSTSLSRDVLLSYLPSVAMDGTQLCPPPLSKSVPMRAYCILLPNGSPGRQASGDQADFAQHGVHWKLLRLFSSPILPNRRPWYHSFCVRMYIYGLSQSGTVFTSLHKTTLFLAQAYHAQLCLELSPAYWSIYLFYKSTYPRFYILFMAWSCLKLP